MSANSPVSFLRTIVAVLRPLLALVLQWMFWPYIQPYVWFLFCLAVFLTSWIGGLSGGLAATVLSTALVLYLFVPPEVLAALGRPRNSLSVVVFMGLGVLFSQFHERLRRTTRHATEALVTPRSTNEQLESRVLQRTAALAQTNESLRASETRLQTIVENLSEGVAVSDLNGRLLHFNRTAVAMHGFDGPDDYLRRLPEFTDTCELATLDGTVFPLEQWPLARAARRDQGSG